MASAGEHILQNALGTRWTSDAIVCDELQKEFGETIDAAIAEALHPFRSLFDVATGRGKPATALRNLESSTGHKAALEPGGILGIEAPRVRIERMPDGSKMLSIAARPGHVDWAVHLVAQQVPELNQAKLRADLQKVKPASDATPDGETVRVQFRAGGRPYERATLKAVFNLMGAEKLPVFDPAFDPVREFVRTGAGQPERFMRYAVENTFQPKTKLGPIDHYILLTTRGTEVIGLVQFFGAIQHVVRLAEGYAGTAFQIGYVVNSLRHPAPAESRIPEFSGTAIPEFERQPPKPGPRVWEWQSARISAVMHAHEEILLNAQIARIIDEVRGPTSAPWTAGKVEELKRRLEKELGEPPGR